MAKPHVIRLRHPWDRQPETGAHPAIIHWQRRFGRPTSLPTDVAVHLVVRASTPIEVVHLNDDFLLGPIAAQETARAEVTGAILARNTLAVRQQRIDVATGDAPDFEVWLEFTDP